MKSPQQYIRTSIITNLKNLGYAVYDRDRKVNDYPYIVIGEQTMMDQGSQDRHRAIATINIHVVNGWSTDFGDRSTADAMVDAITRLITKPDPAFTITGFLITGLTVDNVMSMTEQTQTQTIHTTIVRLKFELFEI